MTLYESWSEIVEKANENQASNENFWTAYLLKEQKNYEKLLEAGNPLIDGVLKDAASSFDMDEVTFTGFLDGINTSLDTSLQLDTLTPDTLLHLTFSYEKLYYEMLAAKADWLYTLPQWDNLLTAEKRIEIKKQYNRDNTVVKGYEPGRNDVCPCGSGKKYKKCCINK